jgi:hypothetical protein
MNYQKARNIWKNNFPKMFTKGYAIMGGVSHKKYTMPRFASNLFIKDLNKKEETQIKTSEHTLISKIEKLLEEKKSK